MDQETFHISSTSELHPFGDRLIAIHFSNEIVVLAAETAAGHAVRDRNISQPLNVSNSVVDGWMVKQRHRHKISMRNRMRNNFQK